MNRRDFLKTTGATAAAGVAASMLGPEASAQNRSGPRRADEPVGVEGAVNPITPTGPKPMMFWDLWKLDRMCNIRHVQSIPRLIEGSFYRDPQTGGGMGSPFFHEASGMWRSITMGGGKIFLYESPDGLEWKPLAAPDVKPDDGRKVAPHHVWTAPPGVPSSLYVDPAAADGFPYKFIFRQRNKEVYERAVKDPKNPWHELARKHGKPAHWMAEEMMIVSPDGYHWQLRRDYDWGRPEWHPEEPYFLFHNSHIGMRAMTCRPGWGDRRVCLQYTNDFKHWTGPRLELQPDAMDTDELFEFYAMPVFPYGPCYVGFIWVAHFGSSAQPGSGVRFEGPTDSQLAYSYDGLRFFRGKRQPFIPLRPAGEVGCGGLRPEKMVVTDDEIRIYSHGSISMHGARQLLTPEQEKVNRGSMCHRLRKDGFFHLTTCGDFGEFTTKKLVLFDGRLSLNAQATVGEIYVAVYDGRNRPIPGYGFEDFHAIRNVDSTAIALKWQGKRALDELVDKPIRLHVKFRSAEIYSFFGSWHFIDAQDLHLLDDGLEISPRWFDT